MIINSICFGDTLKDDPLKLYKCFIEGMFMMDLPQGSLICLRDSRVAVPLAALQHYLQVLHKNKNRERAMIDSARQSIY